MLNSLKEELKLQVVPSTHSDYVVRLPQNAVQLASSKRGQYEIWHIDQRVLCMQSHPEFNANLILETIVHKMYDNGKLDDIQKADCYERLTDASLISTRHTMNFFIFHFLHTPIA